MAQYVGYFQDNVVYEEGPFVVCGLGGHPRIEVELKGHHCPVMMDYSIYRLLDKDKIPYRGGDAGSAVDWLNRQVKAGRIVCQDGYWSCPETSDVE